MDLKNFLSDYSQKAEIFLRNFFQKKKEEALKIDYSLFEALDSFEKSLSGGKKARGALTLLGYQIAGGKDIRAILPVSCGIELFHNFLLIHDDIIDKDELRRGRPTIHKFFADQKKNPHYGLSKAILIGDIGVVLAYELILSADFPKRRIERALQILNDFLLKTLYGQIIDMQFDFKESVSWDDILKVRTYKTSYYTFVLPLSLGAILGGAKGKIFDAIKNFGIPIGIAFQLKDDILGVFGDSKKTGKSNEQDIKMGKKTFLYAKALEVAAPKDKKFLLRWYGVKNLDSKKISRIRKIFRDSGSLEYSLNFSRKLVNEGKKFISSLSENKEIQDTLYNLADFVIERET